MSSKEAPFVFPVIELREIDLTKCEQCGSFHGSVVEQHNGQVPVLCQCDRSRIARDALHFPSPSMLSSDGKTVKWTPITEHRTSDGTWVHTPYFGSILRRIKSI
jgi:hypothetical protein